MSGELKVTSFNMSEKTENQIRAISDALKYGQRSRSRVISEAVEAMYTKVMEQLEEGLLI